MLLLWVPVHRNIDYHGPKLFLPFLSYRSGSWDAQWWPLEINLHKNVRVIPQREDWTGETTLWPSRNGTVCYTDRSKNEKDQGLAFTRWTRSLQTCTIWSMSRRFLECLGAASVFSTSLEMEVYICKDSRASIKHLHPETKSVLWKNVKRGTQ